MSEVAAADHLLIWDSDRQAPKGEAHIVNWNGYGESAGVTSLLRYVEEHAEEIRSRYLAWVDELGESEISGRRIVDRMSVGSTDFSFWWMSSIVEKSFWNSPTMANVVRLLAIDELVSTFNPSRVTVVSDQREVRRAVKRLCKRRKLLYSCDRSRKERRSVMSHRWLGCFVPRPARALRALVDYAVVSRPLRGQRPRRWDDSPNSLFFLSCFGHLTPKEAAAGRFDSRYWDGLYEIFRDSGTPTNWLQYFVTSSDVPDLATAGRWLARIDANPEDQGNHALVSAYFSTKLIQRILGRWFRLVVISYRLRWLGRPGFGPDLHEVLWPVVRSEWLDDLRGARSMHHQLWLAVFEEACADLPYQWRGIYLYEGASWERAFVHAWRSAGHGELIGVPHATIRFWDLRYYIHQNTRERGGINSLPEPDRLVRNNLTARAAFDAVNYPEERTIDCESLRYAHLSGLEGVEHSIHFGERLEVLILGEVRATAMSKMLGMLAETVPLLGFEVRFCLKAHPNSPVCVDDHPSLSLRLVDGTLSDLVADFDVAYSSNGTSAGVDVFLSGLPVLVWLDEDDLNLSDLRGVPEVQFVGTPEDLAESLHKVRRREVGALPVPEFFVLDAELTRWRALLGATGERQLAGPREVFR